MTAHWSSRYVGIPYSEFGSDAAGCNCWGLAVLVYAEELGILLPDYRGLYASLQEQREIAALVAGERGDPVWSKARDHRAFDLALFRQGRLETHVGILISDRAMLHITADEQAKIERIDTGIWRPRLAGIYRHAQTEGARP